MCWWSECWHGATYITNDIMENVDSGWTFDFSRAQIHWGVLESLQVFKWIKDVRALSIQPAIRSRNVSVVAVAVYGQRCRQNLHHDADSTSLWFICDLYEMAQHQANSGRQLELHCILANSKFKHTLPVWQPCLSSALPMPWLHVLQPHHHQPRHWTLTLYVLSVQTLYEMSVFSVLFYYIK